MDAGRRKLLLRIATALAALAAIGLVVAFPFLRERVRSRGRPVVTTVAKEARPVRAVAIDPSGSTYLWVHDHEEWKRFSMLRARTLPNGGGFGLGLRGERVVIGRRCDVALAGEGHLFEYAKLEWKGGLSVNQLTFNTRAKIVAALAVSPDSTLALTEGPRHEIFVHEIEEQFLETTLEGHAATVRAAAVSPDGTRAISAADDGTVKVWDLARGTCLETLDEKRSGAITTVAFFQGGDAALLAGEGGCWTWPGRRTLAPGVRDVTCAAISVDGRLVVLGAADRKLSFASIASGHVVQETELPSGTPLSACFSPDGRRCLVGTDTGGVFLVEVESPTHHPLR